jgi:two-component system, sensor histidine kinase LadS
MAQHKSITTALCTAAARGSVMAARWLLLTALLWTGYAWASDTTPVGTSTAAVHAEQASTANGNTRLITLGQNLSASNSGTDISYATDYWIDEDAQAGILQASSNATAYAAAEPGHAYNIHDKALWLRFDVISAEPDSHWYLVADSATLDSITIYWRGHDGQWKSQQAGDYTPRTLWPIPDRQPTFHLEHDSATPITYYARIQHQRIKFSAPLRIYRDIDYIDQRQSSSLFMGGYFGLLLLALSVGIFVHVTMRTADTKPYMVYVTCLGFSQAALLGLAQQYLWPNSPYWADQCTFTLATLTIVTGIWFLRAVVQPIRRAPKLDFAVVISIALQLTIAAVDLVHPTLIGLKLMTFIMLTQNVLTGMMVYHGNRSEDAGIRWVSWAYIPILFMVLPLLLRNVGLIPSSFLTQYGVIMGSAVEMPLLLYGLFRRTAVRREAQARAAGLSMQDALTGTANLRQLLHAIHGTMTRAAHLEHSYGMILVDLVNHDELQASHGREISDRALVLLATRLQMIAKEVDTVARMKGSQFVLLLEGPRKPASITRMAARIAASGYSPSDLLPVGSSLKLRISCALLPSTEVQEVGEDANAQLNWLIGSSQMLPDEDNQTMRTLNF